MVTKCTHGGDIDVHEYMEGFNTSIVRNGRVVAGHAADPEPSGRGFVQCQACGISVEYNGRGLRRRLPKWARDAIAVAEDPFRALKAARATSRASAEEG